MLVLPFLTLSYYDICLIQEHWLLNDEQLISSIQSRFLFLWGQWFGQLQGYSRQTFWWLWFLDS